MMNKIAPSRAQQTLPLKTKQQLVATILDQKIKQEEYIGKMHNQQIAQLNRVKEQLLIKFQNFRSNSSNLCSKWKHRQPAFGSNDPNQTQQNKFKHSAFSLGGKLDQSIFINQSPTKMSNFGKKLSSQSPIRKLLNKSSLSDKKSVINLAQSSLVKQIKYDRVQQLEKQILEIQLRIAQKEQKFIKSRQQTVGSSFLRSNSHLSSSSTTNTDEIVENLHNKIVEQEKNYRQSLERWKKLSTDLGIKRRLQENIEKLKQELFKQKQSLKVIGQANKNRNKQIIRSGYTQKMLDVIASYGGSRKA